MSQPAPAPHCPGFIYVHAYVVAVRLEFVIHRQTFLRQQVHTSAHLFCGELEEIRAVPKRNDQRVTRANGVAVALTVGQLVAPGHRTWRTEPTGVIRVTHRLFAPETPFGKYCAREA